MINHLQHKLIRDISAIINHVYGDQLVPDSFKAEITQSTQQQFGHYQLNSAMKLGKNLKQNPHLVAKTLLPKILELEYIATAEMAGPGFINLSFTSKYLSEQINKVFADPRIGIPKIGVNRKVVIDFSSPNVAKELHVGHLRSTIIGDSLARLFEFLGYDVVRLNHVGDWGTQFGMLITYLLHFKPGVCSGDQVATLSELMNWYREGKKLFDADPNFKKLSQLSAVELQQGNPEYRRIWKIICEISRKGYEEIYKLLDVELTERGESFYEPIIPRTIEMLEEKGLVTLSDGAKCIFMEGFLGSEGKPLPIILQKSDGGYNYATTDLAAAWHRGQEEKADRMVYVVDSGQKLHLEMIFAAAKKAGFIDPNIQEIVHVGFGVVLGADGKKFKTRSGETERLIDLIQEAIDQSALILKERLPDLSSDELYEMAKILGIDAVKYADLSGHRLKDYAFSYERMLRFEGNTAAFLLYSYVRIQSIKRKYQGSLDDLFNHSAIQLKDEAEMRLGLHILRFPETLELLNEELLPHRLCEYLFNLAETFNVFFRDCQVIGSETETSRLLLCELTGRILDKGLYLLGLKTLQRM